MQAELMLATTVPSSLYVTDGLVSNVMLLRHTPSPKTSFILARQ